MAMIHLVLIFGLLATRDVAGAESTRISTVAMPAGLFDTYMGMPLRDFLKVRKGLKSNSAWVFPEDRPRGWKDPSNPRKIDESAGSHDFKGRHKGHPVFTHASYELDRGRLALIRLDAVIRDTKKVPEARRLVLEEAVRLWGRPDRIEVDRCEGKPQPDDSVKRRAYLAMMLTWTKDDTTVSLRVPEDFEEKAFADDELWLRLAGASGANLILVIGPTEKAILAERGERATIERLERTGGGRTIFRPTNEELQRLERSVNLDAIIKTVEGSSATGGASP